MFTYLLTYLTVAFGFLSEMRPRLRPSEIFSRPRQERNFPNVSIRLETEMFKTETVSLLVAN